LKVIFARAASSDLLEIGDWIAQDSRRRAHTCVEELEAACLGLGANSNRFQLVPGHEASGLRRRVHGAYLIFYRVDTDRVTVLRILHGARDYEPLLFPKDGP